MVASWWNEGKAGAGCVPLWFVLLSNTAQLIWNLRVVELRKITYFNWRIQLVSAMALVLFFMPFISSVVMLNKVGSTFKLNYVKLLKVLIQLKTSAWLRRKGICL